MSLALCHITVDKNIIGAPKCEINIGRHTKEIISVILSIRIFFRDTKYVISDMGLEYWLTFKKWPQVPDLNDLTEYCLNCFHYQIFLKNWKSVSKIIKKLGPMQNEKCSTSKKYV